VDPFDAPAGVRFTCTQCGDCCRNLQVLLDETERARLAALDWAGRADDLAGASTTVPLRDGPYRGRHRLARRPDGACVYLGARQQCRLHEHFGADAKPHTCRSYPFAFRPMGDRVAVDVAFSCRSVSEGTGAPIASRQDEWARLVLERGPAASPPIQLTPAQAMTSALAIEIERVLIAFLGDTSMVPPDRVRCCVDFLRLGLTGDPSTPGAATMRAAMASALPARVQREPQASGMDETQRTVFRQWLFLALNPAPPEFGELSAKDRALDERRRRDAGIAFRDAAGRPVIGGVAIRATFDEVDRVDASLLRRGCDLPTAYLAAKLVGQRFLLAGPRQLPLIEAARLLLLCFPMIAWTSKALAADRGADRVDEPDVRLAIRTIDRTLGLMTTSLFPKPQAKAFHWTFHETDLVSAATHDVLQGGPSPSP
jgi:Fe-S-cluster containining protein